MIVYISGPMAGKDEIEYEADFLTAEVDLRQQGHEVINPIDLADMIPTDMIDREKILKVDLALLDCADAIYLLPGWMDADGCLKEWAWALSHNKKIMRADS